MPIEAAALERAVDALLRSNGGQPALLRVPSPAVPGDDSEQLGLSTAAFTVVEIHPCVFRKTASSTELIVSATAVQQQTGAVDTTSTLAFVTAASGISVSGLDYAITAVTATEFGGTTVALRLALRPLTAVTT